MDIRAVPTARRPARDIDKEVRKIIQDCYDKARAIIEEHMDVLHASAEILMDKERITREEFEALFDTK